MIFATAGHVDHGKTSLVKALTGVDTDRLEEEKARGLTIDLGFAYFHKDRESIGFVDVPGHSKFISNMLAGVAAIDHALIIVAADDGPMPQTQEHIDILQLLGIKAATIVVTKTDRVSPEDLQQTLQRIDTTLTNTPYANAPRFNVSSITQEGISELQAHLWSLKNDLNQPLKLNSENRIEPSNQYFRLAVDRKFTVKGSGLVVTGSVFSGTVKENDELRLMPSNAKVRVRGLHKQDKNADHAEVGDRCSLNLTGDINIDLVTRGDWVTNHPNLPSSNRLDVEVQLLGSESVFKTGTPVHVHLAAQHTHGRIFLLEQRQLMAQETALAQIVTEAPLSGVYGDRLVLRDQTASRTIAGARVLDPISVNRGRSKPARLRYLSALTQQHPLDDLESLVRASNHGIDLGALFNALNSPLPDLPFLTSKKGLYFHADQINDAQASVINTLNSPKTLNELRAVVGLTNDGMELVLSGLIADNKIVLDAKQYRLPSLKPELSGPAENLWKKVQPVLQQAGLQPPVIHELSKQVGLPNAAVEKMMAECIKQDLVQRPLKNRYFLPETLAQVRALAIELFEANGEFTVIEFRDKSSMGRNLCIELLEHLDNKGFTKRLGDKRTIQDKNR